MRNMTFKQKQAVTVLKNKGYKENRDFRVVCFGDRAEIKFAPKISQDVLKTNARPVERV